MSRRFPTRCRLSGALLLAGTLAAAAAEPAPGRSQEVRCTYQVADLVIPVGNGDLTCRLDRPKGGDPAHTGIALGEPRPRQPVRTQEDRLIRLITSTVRPGSWSDRGGPGTIQYFPLTMSLVINQTPDVQEQVADLLAALRRQQDQ